MINTIQSGTPIFIMSSERSGSNLLRRRLALFQQYAYGPPAAHILKHLYFAQSFYGDFDDERNFRGYVEDAISLTKMHFAPWGVVLTPQDVINWHSHNWTQPRTAISVMHSMYTLYAHAMGYTTYICKENNLFDYYHPIASQIPYCWIIYLHRDPRDVIASQLARPSQNQSVAKLAISWRDEQIKSIQAVCDDSIGKKRMITISYENYVHNENEELSRILKFCNLQKKHSEQEQIFSNENINVHEWKNLQKSTNTNSVEQYRQKLSRNQIRIVENVVWHQMRYLGYVADFFSRPVLAPMQIEMDKIKGNLKYLVFKIIRRRKLNDDQVRRMKFIAEMKAKKYI